MSANKKRIQIKEYLIPTLLAILTIIVGFLAAIMQSELIDVPFLKSISYIWTQNIGLPAISGFWVLLGVLIILYLYENKKNHSKKMNDEKVFSDHAAKMDQMIRDVKETLRNQPPRTFINKYKGLAFNINKVSTQTIEITNLVNEFYSKDRTLTELQEMIVEKNIDSVKVILNAIIALAQLFDRATREEQPDVIYTSNIMLFVDTSCLDVPKLELLENYCPFKLEETSLKKMRGCLVLMPELAVDSKEAELESVDVKPIGLQVRFIDEENHEKDPTSELARILPGAPRSCYQNGTEYYNTLESFFSALEQTKVDPVIKDKIKSYFEENNTEIQSFLSIPIFKDSETPEILGVLNIHRNKPNLLISEKLAQMYLDLIQPFFVHLANNIATINKVDENYWFKQLSISPGNGSQGEANESK